MKPYATAMMLVIALFYLQKSHFFIVMRRPKDVNVTWEEISDDKLSDAGRFVVAGSVDETDLKAKAHIRVTAEQSVMSSTANLNGITVNGEALVDFDAANTYTTNSICLMAVHFRKSRLWELTMQQ